MNKYDSIINLKHFEPKYHKRMALINRAMEFSPFAALTGFNEKIAETGRLTDAKAVLTNEEILELNEKIMYAYLTKKEIKIVYFIKDKTKSGGLYKETTSQIKKVDEERKLIELDNMLKIDFNDIINILF